MGSAMQAATEGGSPASVSALRTCASRLVAQAPSPSASARIATAFGNSPSRLFFAPIRP